MLRYTTARDGLPNDALVHAVLAGYTLATVCGRDLQYLIVPSVPTDWSTIDGPRCGQCLTAVPVGP